MSANGLRPYPSYRDSGLDWLGEVPEHWEVRRLKFLLRARHARSVLGKEQLLRVSQYTGITKRRGKDTRAESLIGYRRVAPSDLVVNIMLAWNGSLGVSPFGGIVSPAYCVYRFGANTHPRYAHYLLRSPLYRTRIKTVSTGVVESRLRLYTDDLYRLEALLPPRPEQRAIVRFLDATDRRIRRYIRAKERLIELLEERKRALIHEAVTGRIDVRTGQPYPAYKDSGVEWLGKVPEHWEVRRNVWLFRERNETGFGSLPILEVSLHDGVGIRDMDDGQRKQQIVDRSQYKRAQEGDIAYNTMRMWQGAVGVVPVDGLVSPAYVVADPVECTESRYYGYLFRTRAYKHVVKSFSRGIVSDRDRLYWDDFKRLASLVPPPHEQAAIVGFLDHAVRRIRSAISATQRQIELVHEYRTRRIAEVVTGKLDVREAAATLSETDPLAGDGDRADAIPPESNLHSTAHDMAKEASA